MNIYDKSGNVIQITDIANNLETNDATKALAASQGVTLKKMTNKIPIPNGLTRHSYKGRDIVYNQDHNFAVKLEKTLSVKNGLFQGGACFGNYLFMFTHWEQGPKCWLYNLETGALIQQISIASADQGFVSNCHCNTVTFGERFYDSNDTFPLLYVSTGYGDGTNTGCLVYRVITTTSGGTTVYSLSLVQTIKTPFSTWTEVIPGNDNDVYITNSSTEEYYRIYRFAMPSSDATLAIENALQIYEFTPQPLNMHYIQAFLYTNGCFISPEGLGGTDENFVIYWDLESCTRTIIDIKSAGIIEEPEALFIWQGNLCLIDQEANVFILYFE